MIALWNKQNSKLVKLRYVYSDKSVQNDPNSIAIPFAIQISGGYMQHSWDNIIFFDIQSLTHKMGTSREPNYLR